MVNRVCNRQARAASHFALRKDFQGEPLWFVRKAFGTSRRLRIPPYRDENSRYLRLGSN